MFTRKVSIHSKRKLKITLLLRNIAVIIRTLPFILFSLTFFFFNVLKSLFERNWWHAGKQSTSAPEDDALQLPSHTGLKEGISLPFKPASDFLVYERLRALLHLPFWPKPLPVVFNGRITFCHEPSWCPGAASTCSG